MIFVTVGTHEQQFNRLIESLDILKKEGRVTHDIMMQTGYCDYLPTSADSKKMMGYEEMEHWIGQADIIITHGGPGSVFGALKQGKVPIVVPRRADLGEHVDMHQVEFVKFLEKRNNVITIFDIADLESKIVHYDEYAALIKRPAGGGTQQKFINNFESMIHGLMHT